MGEWRIMMNETRFTKMEAALLDLLERNPGRVVPRGFLLENVWGYKRAYGPERSMCTLVDFEPSWKPM